ncbi:MAG: hypothetical protein U1E62_08555 [Alsobacter sp.]
MPALLTKDVLASEHCRHPCCGKPVLASDGERLGALYGRIELSDGERLAFFIIHLGSVARIGDDARLVPCTALRDEGDTVRLSVSGRCVRDAPIYVEGPRCECEAWLQKLRTYYAKLVPDD